MIELSDDLLAERFAAIANPLDDSDWADVLARARTRNSRRRRLGRFGRYPVMFATSAALAGAAALLLVEPWKGSPELLQQALAAIGSGRYVHAVYQSTSIPSQIDVASGNERPLAPLRIEAAYDTKTGASSIRGMVDGLVFAGGGRPDPAISFFATGYRTALATGKAHVVGTTTVDGEKAVILRFTTHFTTPDGNRYPAHEDVAISTATHIPLRVTRWSPHERFGPSSTTSTWRVLAIDSSNTRPTLPKPLVIAPPVSAAATYIRPLHVSIARAAFGHTPVWPGPVVAGTALRWIHLERLTTTSVGNSSTGLGLQLDYRGPHGPLTVQETAKPEAAAAYGFLTPNRGFDLYTIPAEGQAILGSIGFNAPDPAHPIWHAQLRTHGLYVTIQSPRRDLVVTAARQLVPMR
jgi:hypothetical protein